MCVNEKYTKWYINRINLFILCVNLTGNWFMAQVKGFKRIALVKEDFGIERFWKLS